MHVIPPKQLKHVGRAFGFVYDSAYGSAIRLAVSMIYCLLWSSHVFADENSLTVLTYHDVVADVSHDPYATARSTFVEQMDYLQTHGYQPISLSLLDKVSNKKAKLPSKAVLLSFDDGLKSYADFVVPVLKIYGFPSVLSVVTSWVDGENLPPEYLGKLLSWDELRILQKSPLISIVSHSHNLHHGVPSNPQGNEAAAGTTRMYSPLSGNYETEEQFRQRIAIDLNNTVKRFKQELNIAPIAITWPYGKYDGVLMEQATALGMKLQLTLDEGPASTEMLPRINRVMISNYHTDEFVAELNYQRQLDAKDYFVEIRLDPFAGQTPEQQEHLLSSLLDNLQRLKVNSVLIHPFDKEVNRAFFANAEIEIATDILNRVAHQIKTRLNMRRIYLQIPVTENTKLSPSVIADLARLVWFNGVVFHQQTAKQSRMSVSAMKKTLTYYHPGVEFGRYAANQATGADPDASVNFELIPLDINGNAEALRQQVLMRKGHSGKALFLIKLPESNRRMSEGGMNIATILTLLENLGVRNFGFSYSDHLYGLKDKAGIAHERADDALAVFGG